MAEYGRAVFISYAWGGESENVVNQIDQTLQQRGLKIIRDKRDLGYKGSISAFMERIGQGNCVILIISDKYLRSKNCMFELVETAQGGLAKDSPEGTYDEMARLAESAPPGADGLLFSPHPGGRICPADASMRGAWMGFPWGHTQAHFLRAALESVAYEYAYYLGILGVLIPHLRLVEARAIGGGARNALWNQIKADVLGVPYQRLRRGEFATWGCALIAGHAVGLFPDLTEAADRFAELGDGRFQPRTELYQLYREQVDRYIRFQEALSSR